MAAGNAACNRDRDARPATCPYSIQDHTHDGCIENSIYIVKRYSISRKSTCIAQ